MNSETNKHLLAVSEVNELMQDMTVYRGRGSIASVPVIETKFKIKAFLALCTSRPKASAPPPEHTHPSENLITVLFEMIYYVRM